MTARDGDSNGQEGRTMNVSFKWSEERVKQLDEAIFQAKFEGVYPKNATRSDVLRSLLEEFIMEYREGNGKRRMTVSN